MTRTRIKVCGVASAHDAGAAVAAGADAIGVIFAPSPRQVTIEQARAILADVPPPVARVGVFVDADPAFVAAAVARVGLTAVQFHGDESPETCVAAPAPVIKAFAVGAGARGPIGAAVGTEFGIDVAEPYRGSVAALLLDTYDSQSSGGT
ncbi:MAG: N-(5'-phosphoribosyl)anthranilate isomerase, partial [Actinomycetota bacterium]|nr:N-(5'-phosphoribosyl)anthranilate isomerase [Actinomycetota bacterium]